MNEWSHPSVVNMSREEEWQPKWCFSFCVQDNSAEMWFLLGIGKLFWVNIQDRFNFFYNIKGIVFEISFFSPLGRVPLKQMILSMPVGDTIFSINRPPNLYFPILHWPHLSDSRIYRHISPIIFLPCLDYPCYPAKYSGARLMPSKCLLNECMSDAE